MLQWRDGRVYTFRFDEQAHMTRRPLLSDRPTESPQEALQLLQQVEPSEREDIILGQWMTAIQEKTPEQPGLFGLKTSFGKYLSSDAIGKVFIEREAMGPSEEWLPIKIDSKEEKQAAEADSCALPSIVQFAFRSKLGKYLSFDPIKLNQFRADSEQIGEQETFLIRVQSQKRRANRLVYDGQSATTATKEVDLEKYEETLMYVSIFSISFFPSLNLIF